MMSLSKTMLMQAMLGLGLQAMSLISRGMVLQSTHSSETTQSRCHQLSKHQKFLVYNSRTPISGS